MDAADRGHINMARLLIDRGADVSTADEVHSMMKCNAMLPFVCVCMYVRTYENMPSSDLIIA